jgi:DNA-binding NarL/FixJ family response regulator
MTNAALQAPQDDRFGDNVPLDRRFDALRLREVEVVLALLAGEQARAIAAELDVSLSTIRRSIRTAAATLGCSNASELLALLSDEPSPLAA